MFTGIVTDIGLIRRVEKNLGVVKFQIECGYSETTIDIGASIMHSGVCMTVTEKRSKENNVGSIYSVEAIPETLNSTVLRNWKEGMRINLEQSLKLGDELGGHFVFGHADGVGVVTGIEDEDGSKRISIRPPQELNKYIARKGSIAIDGVSLTVAAVRGDDNFEVTIIPHTWTHTTLSQLAVNSIVNLEIDMLARYVARAIDFDNSMRMESASR